MISTSSALLVLTLLTPFSVRAANDWSVPCVQGGCSWDTGDGKTTAYSSMAIGGTKDLISDITTAAGWSISGCDPHWKDGKHTIQLTCNDPNAHCGHLYEGGAEHTIVRLPENCGKGPFARVVSATNNTDAISRRGAANSSAIDAHTLTLDYDFHQVPTSRGKVTFAVTATNVEGIPGVSKRDLDALRGRGRAGGLHRKRFAHLKGRGFGDIIDKGKDAIEGAAHDAGDAIGDGASIVTSAAGSAASAVGSALSDANKIDKTISSGKLTPISFDKDIVLFDKSISCTSGDFSANAEFKIDVDGKVDATVEFGVTVVGTIVPPKLDDFSVTADVGGSTTATFTVDAKAEGKFDTSPVELFKFGFPGLSIPSIITLGPEFSISAEVSVDLKAEAKLAIQAAWDFPTVKLVFPPEKGASSGDATVSNTNNPLQLSADPSFDVSATITAHIIPRVDFGIDLFDGADQASVFVNADVSATLKAEYLAKAEANNKDTTTTATTANATSTALDAPQTATTNSTITTASTIAAASTASVVVTTPAIIPSVTSIPTSTDLLQATTADDSSTIPIAPVVGANATTTPASVVASQATTATASGVFTTPAVSANGTIIPTSVEVSQAPTATASGVATTLAVISNATKVSTSADVSQPATATAVPTSAHASQTSIHLTTSDATSVGSSSSRATSTSSSTTTARSTASRESDASKVASHTAPQGSDATKIVSISSSPATSIIVGTTSATASTTVSATSGVANGTNSISIPADGTATVVSKTGDAFAAAPTTAGATSATPDQSGGPAGLPTGTGASNIPDDGSASGISNGNDHSAVVPTATHDTKKCRKKTSTKSRSRGFAASPTTQSGLAPTVTTAVPTSVDDHASSNRTTNDTLAHCKHGHNTNATEATGPACVPRVTSSAPLSANVSAPTQSPAANDRGVDNANVFREHGDAAFYNKRSLEHRATSASADACITLSAGIAINAGLTGSLEPFIDKKEVSFKIFSKDVQLFQKCANGPAPSTRRRREHLPAMRRDDAGLQCPLNFGITSLLESLI